MIKNKIKYDIWKVFNKIGFKIMRYRPLRPSMSFVKDKFKDKQLVGVELGVYRGENAYLMLEHMNIKKLYLVDPYLIYKGYNDLKDNTGLIPSPELFIAKETAEKLVKPFNDKVIWYNAFSDNVVMNIPNNLDFVYVDGNHSYKYVLNDIINYYPKLKEKGIIGGHNIDTKDVINAVIDFCNKNNLQINLSYPDWWIVKGEERIIGLDKIKKEESKNEMVK